MLVIDNVIELCLPDDEIHFSPTDLLSGLSNGKDPLYRKGKWVGLETKKSFSGAKKTIEFLETIVSKALSFFAKTKAEETKRDRFYTTASHTLGLISDDDYKKLEPDVILSNKKDDASLQTWRNVLAMITLEDQGGEQLARQICLVFRNQPNRRFVIGILLAGDRMAFSVFDRSGRISSRAFNIHSEPARFLRAIVGVCFCDRETLGFDDSINLSKYTARVADKTYKIKDVIHTVGDICGRGTACYEVELENGKSALLKDTWMDISQEDKEWDIIKEFRDIEHRDCIPEVVAHEEVMCKGQVDTTVRLRESLLKKVISREGDNEKVTWKWKDNKYKRIELRVHSRILMTPFGKKVEQFRSLEELLRVIKHFALVIGEFQEKGRLHRDINLRNLMLQEKDGKLEALLVDYNSALSANRQDTNTVGYRTATVPFMSFEMLDEYRRGNHAYFHDLESLFHVLCWICTVQGGPQAKGRNYDYKETQLFEWTDDEIKLKIMGALKIGVMIGESNFARRFTDQFADYFKSVIPCILKLRRLLFSCYGSSKEDVQFITSRLEALKASSSGPRDEELIDMFKNRLPWKIREPADIVNSFVAILDEGIAALPTEHRENPSEGLKGPASPS